MYATLIRDNTPALLEAEGKACPYVEIKTDSVFTDMLREKLISTTNAFLQSGNLAALAEIQAVIDMFAEVGGENYLKLLQQQKTEQGSYSKKYAYFELYPPVASAEEPMEAQNAAETKPV